MASGSRGGGPEWGREGEGEADNSTALLRWDDADPGAYQTSVFENDAVRTKCRRRPKCVRSARSRAALERNRASPLQEGL